MIKKDMLKIKIKYLILVVFAFFTILSGSMLPVSASAEVYLGGMPAGFTIQTRGAYVMGVGEILSDNGLVSPAKDSQIEVGDIILSIDGDEVNSAKDVEKAIEKGGEKLVVLRRNGENVYKTIRPVKDAIGKYRFGLFLRDTINGIGTITYISNNIIASLGHPVLDERNELVEVKSGAICQSCVTGVTLGKRGAPGALHGTLFHNKNVATINKNTVYGVFATIDNNDFVKGLKKVEIGSAKIGDATIFTTISGDSPREYSISIVKADFNDDTNKGLVIKITDENLLNQTGGIVQGMSGSPIIQGGKLVGAVTHVFINDPTRGFGITIDNMLNNQ